MVLGQLVRSASRGLLYGAGLAAGADTAYGGMTWLRYGRIRPGDREDVDALLDYLIPEYEVVERHHVRVAAPADITFESACEVDLQQSTVIQAMFSGRDLILGGDSDLAERPRGLLASIKTLGWGVLAEIPGREVVVGAVTQPWNANMLLRALPPDEFQAFNEPGYVKIVWTLCADPINNCESIARTETRIVTTDPVARKKFRR
jgi:hypothetical protein